MATGKFEPPKRVKVAQLTTSPLMRQTQLRLATLALQIAAELEMKADAKNQTPSQGETNK